MKIELTKKWGDHPVGTKLQVDRVTGKRLCNNDFAVSTEFVTLHEEVAEAQGEQEAEDIIEDLPERAHELIEVFPKISNTTVLTKYLEDTRITVREAAQARLAELS